MSHSKLNPLTIFYYEEEDVLVWKEFLEKETTTKVIPPTFQQLPDPNNADATRLEIYCTKGILDSITHIITLKFKDHNICIT